MSGYAFTLNGAELSARPAGTLYWPAEALLVVSDLHLGKSERMGRRGGALLPPYEVTETLDRLDEELAQVNPKRVLCLGDSFDDLASGENLEQSARLRLFQMQAGREWIWIEGNHDPGPIDLGGSHLAELEHGPLIFRHIADPETHGEISGHYHPKARPEKRPGFRTRAAFLIDETRVIMPAFGTYTGGLAAGSEPISALMQNDGRAVLTGTPTLILPLDRCAQR